MFSPKLVTCLEGYSWKNFARDCVAGTVVGIVAIPLAVAFAIASGVTPDRGLLTAVVAGFLISALGGSRVQIGGPTGAFVVVVYGIVQQHGVDGLVIATFMGGLLLVAMGVARLGAVVKFIPHSVITGFTSGIAVIIFSAQVKDFLGLPLPVVPADFVAKWRLFLGNLDGINADAVMLGALTACLVFLAPRLDRRIPGALLALVLVSLLAAVFRLPVETIGTRFGELPHSLPLPHLPLVSFARFQELVRPAITIALLGAIESLLSAVVADGMIGGRHRSNTELIGQGLANIGAALFGGMPATGAVARTVTNIKSGGRTPVAGMVHALTVLAAMLFLGPFIRFVPLSCLAGILVVVAYHMSEWRSFRDLLKRSSGGRMIVLTTFLLTVLVDLNTAIEVGMALAAFLFMKRMADATTIKVLAHQINHDDFVERDGEKPLPSFVVPRGVEVYEISGPLFFGAANRFEEVERGLNEKPRVRILRFRDVPVIDATGMRALRMFHDKCRRDNIRLIITGLHVQPLHEIVKADLYVLIGEDNVFSNMPDALRRAEALMKNQA